MSSAFPWSRMGRLLVTRRAYQHEGCYVHRVTDVYLPVHCNLPSSYQHQRNLVEEPKKLGKRAGSRLKMCRHNQLL